MSYRRVAGGFERRPGTGSLAATLDRVIRRLPVRTGWVAARGSDEEREAHAALAAGRDSEGQAYDTWFVDIDPRRYSRFRDDVANRVLWFSHHALWGIDGCEPPGPRDVRVWNEAYEPVNRAFARMVAGLAVPEALVFFQDYHVASAPRHLRRVRPSLSTAHFTHSPFGGPEGFAAVPAPIVRGLVQGMLGADLIGFHVRRWCEAFLATCSSLGFRTSFDDGSVHLGDRVAWVRAYPLPVDSEVLTARAATAAARAWLERLRGSATGRLIVRSDRIDPAKNAARGFQAFGRLLDRRPDLRDCRFVACLYGTRTGTSEYRRYDAEIRGVVADTNARHPGSVELFTDDCLDRSLGAMAAYDVLLVNSLRDGMNLVCKEGALLNQRGGVLVLSTGAGAFAALGEHAVPLVEPADVDATVRALEKALDMPAAERAERARRLRAAVLDGAPARWLEDQAVDLRSIRRSGHPSSSLR